MTELKKEIDESNKKQRKIADDVNNAAERAIRLKNQFRSEAEAFDKTIFKSYALITRSIENLISD